MAASTTASAAVPITAYRYNAKNIFSLILQSNGLETPIIFDSQHTFAVLDRFPAARGHALLIIKHPAATLLDDLPPSVSQAAFVDLQCLVRAVQRATGCPGLRVIQSNGPAAGQTVPQLHFHLLPVYDSSSPSSPSALAPLGPRAELDTREAGALLAHIRNALPEAYAPGYHVWAETEADMEALGWSLQQAFSCPGSVIALSGQLGAGKSTISRGFVRAFVRDPQLEVPSPTFLLCLTYQDDTAYERKAGEGDGRDGGGEEAATPAASADARARCVHHMDPYRLGTKNDKMAGLIDFDAAFRREVCLIEWPDRMPASVMELPTAGVAVDVSGMGAQASGRLVTLTPLGDRFKPPPPKAGKKGAGDKAPATPASAAIAAANPPSEGAEDASAPGDTGAAAPAATSSEPTGAATSETDAAVAAAAAAAASTNAAYAQVLQTWRRSYPACLPPVQVDWRGTVAAAPGADIGPGAGGAIAAAGGGGGVTVNSAAAASIASGDPAQWIVVGIESSCDDTAAAVVRGDGTVLAHQIASQTGLHEQYGGVKPDVARQAHAEAIQSTVNAALAAAGVAPSALTAVAATAGPGLALCLQVGVQHGLSLAARYGLPYIPVHHMEAHAMMTRLPSVNDHPMQFPSLLLLVSGGHNMLVLCEGVGRHRILGTTLDDSVGECFDKIARVVGIAAVPGGPHLERLAASARPDAHTRYPLTMPLANGAQKDSCNFSFSGLKTQVITLITQKRKELGLPEPPLPPALAAAAAAAAAGEAAGGADGAADAAPAAPPPAEDPAEASRREAAEAEFNAACADIAASFQRMAVKFLQQRTRRALQWLKEDALQQLGAGAAASGQVEDVQQQQQQQPGFVRSLVVAGGVAANQAVRAGLSEVAAEFGLPCVYPPVRYCTDNGLMVAWTGVERLKMGLYQQPPRQCEGAALDAHVQVIPRWPIGPMDPRSTANKGRAHIKILH